MNRDHKVRIIASYLTYHKKMGREEAIMFALTKTPDQRKHLLCESLQYFNLKRYSTKA